MAATSSLVVASVILSGPAPLAADNGDPAPLATRSPRPGPSPTDIIPTPTPTCTDYYSESCPAPTPSVIVVSPVPADPSPSPTTQPYLQGTLPSPTPSNQSSDTTSSPVPLNGGFVDQLPSPSAAPTAAATTLAPHQSGVPLPFLAVGAVLILAAVGSMIFALAPRNKTPFAPRPTAPTSTVKFTPYGPETSPGTNILKGGPPGPG